MDKLLSICSHSRILLLSQLRPERITATSYSTIELYQKLKEEILDRLPQPLQLKCDPVLFLKYTFFYLFFSVLFQLLPVRQNVCLTH